MPELQLPDALKHEVKIGNRGIPLYVPVAGAVLAIGVFALSRLRGGKAAPSGGETAAAMGGLASLQESIAKIQSSAAEQIGGLQKSLNEQQAAFQAGLAEQSAALQSGIAGVQGQLTEQASALQSGIAGVQTQTQQLRADMLTRIAAVETRVGKIETEGAPINRRDRQSIGYAVMDLLQKIDQTRHLTGTQRLETFSLQGTGDVLYSSGAAALHWAGAGGAP